MATPDQEVSAQLLRRNHQPPQRKLTPLQQQEINRLYGLPDTRPDPTLGGFKWTSI